MSVRVEADVIHLIGRCLAEDAESVLLALQEEPGRTVDLAGVQRVHLAVVQVLLAIRPPVRGMPDNDFIAGHLFNLLQ
jgi:hypothetical protein